MFKAGKVRAKGKMKESKRKREGEGEGKKEKRKEQKRGIITRICRLVYIRPKCDIVVKDIKVQKSWSSVCDNMSV